MNRLRTAATVLALLVFAAAGTAQQASFTAYGTACPNAQNTLQIQGLPQLGTTFTVQGIPYPGACTRKFCPCPCCDCNTCSGALLLIGTSRVSIPLPGPNGCLLLARPDVPLIGNQRGDVAIRVPNLSVLLGGRFNMQRIDVQLEEVTGSQCSTTYRLIGFRGSSNGVEATVGR